MAIYKLFPEKDTTLYTISQSMNTGIDEILDCSTYVSDGVGQVNRSIIKFADSEISNVYNMIKLSCGLILTTTMTPSPNINDGTPGTYTNVPITSSGLGQDGLATVVVGGGGSVTSVTITSAGSSYSVKDTITIEAGALGASSSQVTLLISEKNVDFGSNLRLFAAVVSGLSQDAAIEVYPISQSWDMGTGKYFNAPQTQNGASWIWNTFSGSSKWQTTGFAVGTPYVTASYVAGKEGGGTWYYADTAGNNYNFKQDYTYANPIDLNVEVSPSIQEMINYISNPATGQKNDGFIVKQSESQEFLNDVNTQATFRFFSIDTNTIYPPQLEMKWDNYTFNTGSSTNKILNNNQALMSVYNNQQTYYSQSIVDFRIAAMPQYPDRVFQTASVYTTNYFLPEDTSLYAIKDSETNEMVIDFDSTYTKISADSESSYFTVYMNGLEPERDYTILIKTIMGGVTQVFDEDMRFKVVNG